MILVAASRVILRGILLRLLAASLTFLLALAAVEVGLRIVPLGADEFVDTTVRERTQSRGKGVDWRNRQPPGQKEPNAFRVLAIGDSFAWGGGVHSEDAWPDRLERRLREFVSDHEFEVINWSRPGWNTFQAWQSAGRNLASLEPDLVILGFTLNDAEPNGHGQRVQLAEPLNRRGPSNRLSRALHRHSVLYRLLWERLENVRQRRAFVAYYRALYEGPAWEGCKGALRYFRDGTARLSIPLLLVVFPIFDSQLDDSYPYFELHRKMAATAAELGIAFVDLLKVYRGVDGRRLAVAPFTDPHPSELAQRIASDHLAIHLVKKELVPAAFPPGVRRPPTAVGQPRPPAWRPRRRARDRPAAVPE